MKVLKKNNFSYSNPSSFLSFSLCRLTLTGTEKIEKREGKEEGFFCRHDDNLTYSNSFKH